MQRTVEEQLRRFLLGVSGCVFLATIAELWLVEHAESVVQAVPFVLCAVAIIFIIWVAAKPSRAALLATRIVMALVAGGSIYGWYEHVSHNIAFELEIRSNATAQDVLWEALSGASPLLAPGILALGALLAAAATYRHPVLSGSAAGSGLNSDGPLKIGPSV